MSRVEVPLARHDIQGQGPNENMNVGFGVWGFRMVERDVDVDDDQLLYERFFCS